jgi:hypothetical protein
MGRTMTGDGPSGNMNPLLKDRLRDLESLRDAALAHLDTEHLLMELLDRVSDILASRSPSRMAWFRGPVRPAPFPRSWVAARWPLVLRQPDPPLPHESPGLPKEIGCSESFPEERPSLSLT